MGILPTSYVFENLQLPILLHYFALVQCLEPFPSPCPFPIFSFLPYPHFHKPYLQSKSFLNTWAVPNNAAFCSDAVLITTPSSSIQFFSFFYVLPTDPTTTGITLMLLMLHILLISLFTSRYLSVFSFSFWLILMSLGMAISIMAQLLSFLFTTTISGFLALISLSHWIITTQKIFTSSFSATPSGTCLHEHTQMNQ